MAGTLKASFVKRYPGGAVIHGELQSNDAPRAVDVEAHLRSADPSQLAAKPFAHLRRATHRPAWNGRVLSGLRIRCRLHLKLPGALASARRPRG